MELPTSRELELEALLRQRDTQLSELSDEVTRLRQYLSSQPGPSTTASLSLPPALSSILLSHLSANETRTATSCSNTVVAALTQRTRLLQEENDELYELLRQSETGKLKEEVRGLRRLVQRLQGALQQSHDSITILSRELDKTYESFMNVAPPASNPQLSPRTYPPSPRNNYSPVSGNGTHASKPPPTGPRKRPRLSEPNSLPFNQSYPGKSHNANNHNHYGHNVKRGMDGHPKRGERDVRGGSDANKGNRSSKMDVDSERPSSSEPGRGRDKDADREYDKDRDRDRERNRERDRDRGPKDQDHNRDRDRGLGGNPGGRRNVNGPGRGGGRRGERMAGGASHSSGASFHGAGNAAPNNNYNINGDRTLAERMGL